MESRRVTLTSIDETNTKYQVRNPKAGTWGDKTAQELTSKRHIDQIARDLLNDRNIKIEPIEVIEEPAGSNQYIITDGFHRFRAFKTVNKKTKGKRFKQITVRVLTKDELNAKYLETNTQHKALPLQGGHATELKWQKFLRLEEERPSITKKELSEILLVATSTIGNWRNYKKQFLEEGYFEKNSRVPKDPVTGFPLLKPSKDELKKDNEWAEVTYKKDDAECLHEADKILLQEILKKIRKSKEPEKLREFVLFYWGEDPKYVDYDATIGDLEDDF